MNYRYDRADSATCVSGTLGDITWRTIGQLEWRATEHWRVQGGAMFENSINWSYRVTNLHPSAFGQSSARNSARFTGGETRLDQRRVMDFSAERVF